jgi:TldD protein
MAGLAAEYDVVLVARSDGTRAADVRPLVRLSDHRDRRAAGRREVGTSGGGGRFGLGYFTDAVIEKLRRARPSNAALTNLESRPAPAGEMTVVLGPGWPGVLLHEAVGHGLEGDFNRKGSSAPSPAASASGSRPRASPCSTTARSPTGAARSTSTTKATHPAQRADRRWHPARLHPGQPERAPDGREGDRQRPPRELCHVPMPRMTNTYMLAGDKTPRDRGQHQAWPVRHQLRRRPGRHHQRQVRVLGQRGLLGRERARSCTRSRAPRSSATAPMR